METTAKKKVGNPNFAKKKAATYAEVDGKKRYQFQLCQAFENAKGRDKETGEVIGNPYPPMYIAPNSGVALDPETKEVRRWRYIYGYNSIWVDEQTSPEPTPQQIGHERNDIIFREGSFFVNGNNKALMQALMVQDAFEGNPHKLEQKPSLFKLIDEDATIKTLRSKSDNAYEAEKTIREAEYEELLPLAMVFGINTSKVEDEEDEELIRTQLILKAKSDPEIVLREQLNPLNNIKYLVKNALDKGVLKVYEGKLMYDTDTVLFNVNVELDVPEQVAKKIVAKDEVAMKLYSHLQG